MKVPAITTFADRKVSSSTKVYDRTGTTILYDVHANIKRTVVTQDQISHYAQEAIISIEDKDFYSHHGIKPVSIIRAGLSQFLPFLKQSGGSTITQQLVKNTLLTQQKSFTRKVKEWVLALKLERVMTKEQILTTYLNEAPYGGTIYGIQEASNSFFGKNAIDLTIAESAYLAAIPNAPTYYSPYGKNKSSLESRKNFVLKNMLAQAYIDDTQYAAAKAEVVNFKPLAEGSGKALHFIEYIRQYIESKYGTDVVANAGLKVVTTLDWDLQQVAEKTILENSLKNEKDYGASNSGLIAIDPKTGHILSMVGSRDYFDRKIDGAFNITTAGRQPGSSFKPLVYARAFEKGFLPETTLFDIPTQFGPCDAFDRSSVSPCYAPDNYDNKFLGPISLRNALAQSRNIPAVQLLSMVGLPDALETAKRLGLTTLDRNADRYGLTLVLGGGEVSLLDMTSVYGVFANEGVRNQPTGILEITDANGNILEKYIPNPELVIDPNATRNLSSVLSDNTARTPLFGATSFPLR
jgi:membrane peptidoglycan carboxypeptidase